MPKLDLLLTHAPTEVPRLWWRGGEFKKSALERSCELASNVPLQGTIVDASAVAGLDAMAHGSVVTIECDELPDGGLGARGPFTTTAPPRSPSIEDLGFYLLEAKHYREAAAAMLPAPEDDFTREPRMRRWLIEALAQSGQQVSAADLVLKWSNAKSISDSTLETLYGILGPGFSEVLDRHFANALKVTAADLDALAMWLPKWPLSSALAVSMKILRLKNKLAGLPIVNAALERAQREDPNGAATRELHQRVEQLKPAAAMQTASVEKWLEKFFPDGVVRELSLEQIDAHLEGPRVRYPRALFAGFDVPESTLAFLERVGLPKHTRARNMTFDSRFTTKAGVLYAAWSSDDMPSSDDVDPGEPGPIIGGDGAGNHFYLKPTTEEVWFFDHDTQQRLHFVAPSVEALATGLILLDELLRVAKPLRSRGDYFPDVLVQRYVDAIEKLDVNAWLDVVPSKAHDVVDDDLAEES